MIKQHMINKNEICMKKILCQGCPFKLQWKNPTLKLSRCQNGKCRTKYECRGR